MNEWNGKTWKWRTLFFCSRTPSLYIPLVVDIVELFIGISILFSVIYTRNSPIQRLSLEFYIEQRLFTHIIMLFKKVLRARNYIPSDPHVSFILRTSYFFLRVMLNHIHRIIIAILLSLCIEFVHFFCCFLSFFLHVQRKNRNNKRRSR